MKHFALLVSILSITFSCANQKNIDKKTISNSAQINKEVPLNKSKFAPNTIALNIKISEIIQHENYYEVVSTVEKTLGSGAGIIGMYSKGIEISFETKRDLKLSPNSDYSFLFKETQTMGENKTGLKLIKAIE